MLAVHWLLCPAPAEAQSDPVWSATLSVQNLGGGYLGCRNSSRDRDEKCSQALSNNSFTYESVSYHVISLYRVDQNLIVALNRGFPNALRGALKLNVGSVALALSAATYKRHSARWCNTSVNWSSGDEVAVTLTVLAEGDRKPVPTTAALSADNQRPLEGSPVTVTATLDNGAKAPSCGLPLWVSSSGTATAGSDYELPSDKRIMIPAGAASGSMTMSVLDDDVNERDETVVLWARHPGTSPPHTTTTVRLTIVDNDRPGVTVSASSLTVAEGGTKTYTVKLNTRPSANVTVTPASSSVAKASVSGALTFTPGAWNTAKTVTVTGVEDADAASDRATIRHTASSGDGDYGGRLAIDQVAVAVSDDDATVALSATPNPVTEGSPVTVTARLSAALTSDVAIPVALTADTAETGDYGPLLSITISHGTTTGAGTISTAQDTDTDDEGFTVALGTMPNGVAAGSPNSVQITISDDDSGGDGDGEGTGTPPTADGAGPQGDTDPEQTAPTTLTLKAGSSPAEGRAAVRLSVALDQPSPRGGMKVKLSLGAGTATEGADGDFTLAPMTIAIGEGESVGQATLIVVDDATDEDSETVEIQAVCPNEGLTADLRLAIADNDEAGVTVSPAALSVAEGATATYTIVLDSRPMADVEVTASSGTPAKTTVAPATATFTPEEWNKAKTITVTGMEAGSATIAHRASSTDGKYGGGLRIGSVAVAVTASRWRAVIPAWHARFGRTVTGQVLEAVEERLAAPREAGVRATLAGHALAEWTPGSVAASDKVEAIADGESGIGAWEAGILPGQAQTMTERELLGGSSFGLTGGAAAGGHAGLWGRGAHGRFDGREGEMVLDGEVTAGLVGADWASAPGSGAVAGGWSAGLAVGHARGAGGYHSTSFGDGAVEAALTGFYPYGGVALADWLSAWAAAGYGSGDVTVQERGRTALKAGLTLAMGAAGLRSEVARPPVGAEGLSLAVTGDARITYTSSPTARTLDGELAATEADTWLARAGVEGARRFALGTGRTVSWLTLSVEAGARMDGGAAENGIGADLAGGLAFVAPASGLGVDLKARGLVAHQVRGLREWGASAALAYDPRPETEQGLSLSLKQSWGATPAGGMGALLSRETLAGLAGDSPGVATGAVVDGSRLEGEVGYGLPVHGGGFIGTPNVGLGLSDGGVRDWRIGWRLTSAEPGDAGIEVRVDAIWSVAASSGSENGVRLTSKIRW